MFSCKVTNDGVSHESLIKEKLKTAKYLRYGDSKVPLHDENQTLIAHECNLEKSKTFLKF